MDYLSIVNSSKEKVGNYAIATKILDLMDNLRLDERLTTKRRWIWELMQNAKDVKYKDRAICIRINFEYSGDSGYVEFSHTGQPFRVDNLTFLIEQVSTKERGVAKDAEMKPTGKFGTGFLTTHLLSEIAEVRGFLKEPELPYKHFNLTLDRRGRSIQAVTNSVEKSLKVLNDIEKAPSTDHINPNDYNTSFKYTLSGEGIDVARAGIQDLETALPFTLVFLSEISLVELVSEASTFQLEGVIWDQDGIKLHKVVYDSIFETKEIYIVSIVGERATIAIPVNRNNDESITVLPISTKLPKLHCDFPLIGSEELQLPFVVNSSHFNPNEPRDGVFLTDREDERIKENKDIFKEAVELFQILVRFASENDWHDVLQFAAIGDPADRTWLSKTWFQTSIQEPIQSLITTTPLVDTNTGSRVSITNEKAKYQIWFPSATKKDVREHLWQLCSQWIPANMPKLDALHQWHTMWWSDENRITINKLGNWLQNWGSLSKLQDNLAHEAIALEWLNSFYELVNLEGRFLNDIVANKVAVIPNQEGIFKPQKELYIDKNIDEALKDILFSLNENVRESLLQGHVQTNNKKNTNPEVEITYFIRDAEYVVTKINKILARGEHPNCFAASLSLIALKSPGAKEQKRRDNLFEIASVLYPDLMSSQRTIYYEDESVWHEAEKLFIKKAVETIAACKSIAAFAASFEFENEVKSLEWLNDFIAFLVDTDSEHHLNITDLAILPNQNGNFIIKDATFLDDCTVEEPMKDICELLGSDIRAELLKKEIYLDLGDNRTHTRKSIADRITTMIYPRFAEVDRGENTKNAFRLLSIWFQHNRELAAEVFPELYAARHKLYDDEEVVSNMQAAEDIKQLMEKYDIPDMHELQRRIAMGSPDSDYQDAKPITADTLVSLGIGSIEELQDALKDINLAQLFSHESKPTVEMFVVAQQLISRAKDNILNFLGTLPDYDCTEAEELARTIVGGIYYKGMPINVVCRPSDNGEVIIYYSSEKDTLELPESQLWIDDGIRAPRQLTLGKILKDTGINRIPVKI